jgi:NAD(P)-dependent dehydrogenase (short-subunit alcohol dehydrogenase family)
VQIDGSVVIVTGGASGLGQATARRLARDGAAVVIVDQDDGGRALAKEIDGLFVFADVTSEPDVSEAVLQAKAIGTLRAAVNCAGVGWGARVVDRQGFPHDLDLFRRVIEINLIGTFNVLRLSAAAMAENEPDPDGERGVVINTASTTAFEGQVGQSAYAASKSAVVGLTLTAARDLASRQIRVMAIAPGIFQTPMLVLIPEKTRKNLISAMAYPQRTGMPDEFARLAADILANPYLNGETIRLDAGLRMTPR